MRGVIVVPGGAATVFDDACVREIGVICRLVRNVATGGFVFPEKSQIRVILQS